MSDTMTLAMRPKKPPTKQIRFRADLANKLEYIGFVNGQDLPDLADAMFRTIIEREHARAMERYAKQQEQQRRAGGE
jgi:hypothetical protein